MDESCSVFQEKKKTVDGPKTKKVALLKTNKPKKSKRIKGQKDIRIALSSKKNQLVSYSKDFDYICKQSGIDVDSEDLQIAIALSKSIEQTSISIQDSSNLPPSINTCDRVNKIRTTLQEYGFKVPEIKINLTKNKRTKKCNKQYKLLLTTEVEKQKPIFDKYSQVLFESLDFSTAKNDLADSNVSLLYKICTGISYKVIKSDDIYYVKGLLENNSSTVGCLLRDWSEIPGRPTSPSTFQLSNMNFSEIECSQDELDVILSGSLKNSKLILAKKHCLSNQGCQPVALTSNRLQNSNEKILNSREFLDYPPNLENCTEKNAILRKFEECRSVSPDIFDDTSPTMEEFVQNSCGKFLSPLNSNMKTNDKECIDLTHCVDVAVQESFNEIKNDNNITKRQSNDFMEITKCVETITSINQNSKNCIISHQHPIIISEKSDDIVVLNRNYNTETMDITETSNSSDDNLPFVELGGIRHKSLDKPIILDKNEYNVPKIAEVATCDKSRATYTNQDSVDLELKASTEKLDKNNIIATSRMSNYHLNYSATESFNGNVTNFSNHKDNIQIDLTQYIDCNEELHSFNGLGKKDNLSVDYDEILENQNAATINMSISMPNNNISNSPTSSSCSKILSENVVIANVSNSSQHSEVFTISDNELNYSLYISKYREGVCHDCVTESVSAERKTNIIRNSVRKRSNSLNNDVLTNLHTENFSHNYLNTDADHLNKTGRKSNTASISTPVKENEKISKWSTPLNGEYMIKTDQVTPMLDFESMSTPERNKELGKYGVKPFKRKRAIQLLTHIYNQTHPLIEPCLDEEVSSPSKKLKINTTNNINKSPSKKSNATKRKEFNKFPKKQSKSPRKKPEQCIIQNSQYGHNIYEATSELPDIRDIQDSLEDWILPKTKKNKVHSCAVPLHIAFHNYVTCRLRLHEAILRYEPVHIDVIHKDLVSYGYRFDPKDLLKFLDKKCITVKTLENNSRNKHY